MNTTIKKQEGFTIIEVVLVLAIAALIMLMVFIALPALQRNQRDQQREQDVSRLASAVQNYKGRNKGMLPGNTTAAWETFFTAYLKRDNDGFADPQAGNYRASVATTAPATMPTITGASSDDDKRTIYIYIGATCDGERATGGNSGARRVALVKPLEGGGNLCQQS